jgi:hypothetical protein
MRRAVFIGFDRREQDAFAVAASSLQHHSTEPL